MRLGCAATKSAGSAVRSWERVPSSAPRALQAEAEDLKIRSPIIEPHELEFENNFSSATARPPFTSWNTGSPTG